MIQLYLNIYVLTLINANVVQIQINYKSRTPWLSLNILLEIESCLRFTKHMVLHKTLNPLGHILVVNMS